MPFAAREHELARLILQGVPLDESLARSAENVREIEAADRARTSHDLGLVESESDGTLEVRGWSKSPDCDRS